MKATGIVRRIDDLGRVVIPKEIRRTMRIREGDPLEIYTTKEGEVIFKKYSLLGGLEDFAAQFCDTLSRSTDFTAAITDRDSIIGRSTGMLKISSISWLIKLVLIARCLSPASWAKSRRFWIASYPARYRDNPFFQSENYRLRFCGVFLFPS